MPYNFIENFLESNDREALITIDSKTLGKKIQALVFTTGNKNKLVDIKGNEIDLESLFDEVASLDDGSEVLIDPVQ